MPSRPEEAVRIDQLAVSFEGERGDFADVVFVVDDEESVHEGISLRYRGCGGAGRY